MSDDAGIEFKEIFPGVFRLPDPKNPKKTLVATQNLTPGKSFYGERLSRIKKGSTILEFRLWDPFRSKLSASIINGLRYFPFEKGRTCLYLGASTGTTVSHISDILGETGKIFAVEMAPRVARELLENLVRFRKNIVPIIADARHPQMYGSVYGIISIIYCDIAQPDQTDIAIANCERYLEKNGMLFLVVKASSINALQDKQKVIDSQIKVLRNKGFSVLERIDLEPYDRNHAMLVCKMEQES